MNFRESDLPGIGKKFQLLTRGGDKLVIIVHDDGRRELYHYNYDDLDESISQVTLDDDEARLIASVVGGMAYTPKQLDSIEVGLHKLVIEWYRLEPGMGCIGRSIGDLQVRQQTGATIIAVIAKNQESQINPGPEVVLRPETTLVVAGERRQQKHFRDTFLSGGGGG
ncbi:TrkA domain protein [Paenibacillus phyllosphaerae]|uniref:TrkA domain protein n=1 Tax=Paenibacillus phyllosphaerae TaxID=274593 RepID=A0A7W5B017_9BACL|nr:cation:proton antiporter regulatory subunit [Paenibacillus phyllosphaerae]MBB3111919.1 TrkA domain protein [Paenibacillus phyllosphaerae]